MNNSAESLTVSELNNFIRDVLSSGFPQAVWVCGEVQELRDKKHLYFTLSEKDQDSNAITAKIGATIWANTRPKIEAILQKAENAFVLKDDIEVKLLCKVDFYPPFGQVRLIVESIDPTYTLGKIAQDRQRLIAQLKQKGVLDKNKQLTMPLLPLSIGLITSYDSAAYHDFMDELKKSGYTFSVWVLNCIMQGKTTEVSVSRAIKFLNAKEDIDVIVITRGGGSMAELSCFDSQMIAEAIASSRLPVLTGIGHEINTTVTDLAAHTFAKTPTAAARFLIVCVEDFLDNLKNYALNLQNVSSKAIQSQMAMIARTMETLKRLPDACLRDARQQCLQKFHDLNKTIQLRLKTSRTKIEEFQKLLEMADPKRILKRGFSITRDAKGKVIKSSKNLKKGVLITTQISDAVLTSSVEEVKKGSYGIR